MNKFALFFTSVFISFTFSTMAQNERIKVLFNEDWRFHKGEPEHAQEKTFDDQDWRTVALPHDWSVEGPFSEKWASGSGYLPGGIAWYRKTFKISPDMAEKQIALYFDGVYKNSEVWINGKYLGKRPNGHIPFQYDITPHLVKNGENVVAVKVDHTQFADSRWYNGSGIYRNVYLIGTEQIHISQWGIAFTTPVVSQEKATAKVVVSVENDRSADSEVTIRSVLRDLDESIVADAKETITVKQNGKLDKEINFEVQNPALWSVDDPNLYKLEVSLVVDNQQTDEVIQNVGFRTFRFDADEGFFLNGENMKLKGVCIHQDAGALGSAVPQEVWRRRLQSLKELGCNAIRMSHYPHQDYLYDLCDEMGFLVQDEAFDEWEVGKNKWIAGWNVGTPGNDGAFEHFDEWADQDLQDMILRNRNHVSIIMWSIGNEIDYPNDPYTHKILDEGRNPQIYGKGYQPQNPSAERLGEIAERLVKVAKKYDTSRPITAALAGVTMSNFTSYPDALDMVGYNYQEYRYAEDHAKYPDRIIYGSENGDALEAWLAVENNDYISSQFLWTAFDFLGEARSWPSRASGAGILDLAGFPKPDYYFRQSLWSAEPMIYIGTTEAPNDPKEAGMRNAEPKWNWKAGEKVRVSCYTNTEEAELYLNGKSIGKKALKDADGKIIFWDIDYQPGELSVKGYNAGKEIASHKLATPGKPFAIKAVVDRKSLDASKKEILHVALEVVDEKGNLMYGAENEISVKVKGPAILLGLESGSLDSHEDYKAPVRKVFKGKLLAYVQSSKKPGDIIITFASKGLKSQTVNVASK